MLIVISNSGINPLPIELAEAGRARGLTVVAITNVKQSRQLTSRHASGVRLIEVADIVLDNHAPHGEAVLELPGVAEKVATVGTITGAFLVNALLAGAVQELAQQGEEPPLYTSENVGAGNAAARNAALRHKYQGRLRRAGV